MFAAILKFITAEGRVKIGIDARSLLTRHPRGEGKTLLHLYQEMSILRPEWEFVFYGKEKQFEPINIRNLAIKVFDFPGFRFNTWENIGLPYHVWRDKVDILHCAGSSAPLRASVPIVLTIHDIIPLVFDDGLGKKQIDRFRRQLMNGVRSACAIIAVSENSKRDLCHICDVSPQRVHVIHWGAKHADAPLEEISSSGAWRQSLAAVPRPYILAFGGAAKRKNTEKIVLAFSILAKTLQDVRLVLVGINSPSTKEKFLYVAERLGVSNRVHILDFVSEQELNMLYRDAECLLYPSLYEGFGMPLVEAMSRGTPIVGSNTTSIPEVLGDAGVLVDPENELAIAESTIRLLTDARLMTQMKILARRRAEDFCWRRAAEATVRIFEGCARRH